MVLVASCPHDAEGDDVFFVLDGPYANFAERLEAALDMLQSPVAIVPDLFRDPKVRDCYHGQWRCLPEAAIKQDLMLQIYKIGDSQMPSLQIPDDFYEVRVAPPLLHLALDIHSLQLSSSEVKQQQQHQHAAVEEASQLRTQAMRDAQSARRRRRYAFAFVRIRFPDRFVLQGARAIAMADPRDIPCIR